jgi:hypothetical protein
MTRTIPLQRHLVSIPEAREILGGIGHTNMYAIINRGEVVKVKLGGRSFITAESLEALVDRLTATATGASV